MTETSSDISLEALRSGDRIHFARLVDAYSIPVYRLALRMLGNEQDAEDVLQTTFIKALQHVSEFEGRSSLATWLYRIAANEALMLLRRKRPSVSLDEEPVDDDGEVQPPRQLADWTALPESDLLNAEVRAQLDRAIQSLPLKLRAVFLMRDIEGLSIKETGEALDLTETAVKTRLLRARLHLREQLAGYFGERLRQEKKMKDDHKLECHDLLGNLSDFIDGELDDVVCQELQRHMAGCENCRVVFDTTTRTIYLYQSCANEIELPTGARERLFDTLHLDDLLKPKS